MWGRDKSQPPPQEKDSLDVSLESWVASGSPKFTSGASDILGSRSFLQHVVPVAAFRLLARDVQHRGTWGDHVIHFCRAKTSL